jgi:hypothetical protein
LENDALYWFYNCSPRETYLLVGLIMEFQKSWDVRCEEENVENLVGEPVVISDAEEERSGEVIEDLFATSHKSFEGYAL